ncbi:ABC transporter permease [Mycolicibacterium sp. P9-64]|uniref:ABC transporter permease n=1 Tax=Mycolicibacterium sp. P9-64 TaxID=2024612 RepID=UPI0011ECEAC1|nr:ABC transporter permease [Mycolicibacterium sp. P9-64]KAA0084557.1 ABC transporter permease [Mycolicibacterium sp. P9-64]
MTTTTEPTLAVRRRLLHIRMPRSGLVGWVAATVIVLATLVAIFAPLIAPQDPNSSALLDSYADPSADHLLGADALGRDILSRLIWGARPALLGPLCVIVSATVVGVVFAIVAAWKGGWVNTAINAVFNVLFSFPAVLLAILAATVLGAGLLTSVAAISFAYIPYFGRIIRSEGLRQRSLPYVSALEIQGVSSWRICVGHLLPNLAPLILAQMTASFGYAMVDLAALSYLGLGAQPPAADWGQMVGTGQAGIVNGHPAESLYAGALILIVVIAFTTLGDQMVSRTGDVRE